VDPHLLHSSSCHQPTRHLSDLAHSALPNPAAAKAHGSVGHGSSAAVIQTGNLATSKTLDAHRMADSLDKLHWHVSLTAVQSKGKAAYHLHQCHVLCRILLDFATQDGFHHELPITSYVTQYMLRQGQTSLHWATRSLLNIWLWPHGLSKWDVAILSLMPCTDPATLSTPLPTGKPSLLRRHFKVHSS